jgi:alpha-galactosidase
VARAHPDWLAIHEPTGRPLVGMVNDGWGGAVNTLDPSNPEVLDHLEHVARSLVEAGYPYLKLDFTFAPTMQGGYADRSFTPAQRVRAGFDAVRRGAGDDAFLLGCGAPIGATVGVVDGMRIGADVAPWWHPQPDQYRPPGHLGGEPATVNAWRNTLSRSFMHRQLWLNDPDCLMLRAEKTKLEPEQMRAWALAVGVSGGMALVSDDLALLGPAARARLDEVVALGREADAGAHPPRCLDLMDADPPSRLATATVELVGDPGDGHAYVQGLLA